MRKDAVILVPVTAVLSFLRHEDGEHVRRRYGAGRGCIVEGGCRVSLDMSAPAARPLPAGCGCEVGHTGQVRAISRRRIAGPKVRATVAPEAGPETESRSIGSSREHADEGDLWRGPCLRRGAGRDDPRAATAPTTSRAGRRGESPRLVASYFWKPGTLRWSQARSSRPRRRDGLVPGPASAQARP